MGVTAQAAAMKILESKRISSQNIVYEESATRKSTLVEDAGQDSVVACLGQLE